MKEALQSHEHWPGSNNVPRKARNKWAYQPPHLESLDSNPLEKSGVGGGCRIDFPKSGRAEKMRTQKQLEFVEEDPEKKEKMYIENPGLQRTPSEIQQAQRSREKLLCV